MRNLITICAVAAMMLAASSVAQASWETFVIRGDASVTANQTAPDATTGWTMFDVSSGGEKAGWGTNSMNGKTVGDIQSLSITRYVPVTGDTTYAPYFNIWITNGTEYAILANEPSDGEWVTGGVRHAWDLTWSQLEGKRAKIYEDSQAGNGDATSAAPSWIADLDLTVNGGNGDGLLTFGELASLEISAPSSAPSYSGTGAPDDLDASTYTAYGFNWVFGDTQSNYVGGHLAQNPTLTPEPATMSLLAIGGLAVLRRRRKKA
jgi:hypothetical protein